MDSRDDWRRWRHSDIITIITIITNSLKTRSAEYVIDQHHQESIIKTCCQSDASQEVDPLLKNNLIPIKNTAPVDPITITHLAPSLLPGYVADWACAVEVPRLAPPTSSCPARIRYIVIVTQEIFTLNFKYKFGRCNTTSVHRETWG